MDDQVSKSSSGRGEERRESEAVMHRLPSASLFARWSVLCCQVRKARHPSTLNNTQHSRLPPQVSSVHIHRVADDVCCSHRQLSHQHQFSFNGDVPRASAQLHIETFCQMSDRHPIADARPTTTPAATNPANDDRIAAILLLRQLTRQGDVVFSAWGKSVRVFSSNIRPGVWKCVQVAAPGAGCHRNFGGLQT